MKTRVLILGGGFAGLYTALHLDKKLAKDPQMEVVLVNRENYFLFTPMLHEIAASDLDITHIVNPIRKLLKRVKFFEGEVTKIDLAARQVEVAHGLHGHSHTLKYDHLVIGLGSVTNFFNTPGLQELALTMKSLGDAIYLRNRLIAMLEEAEPECNAPSRCRLLTFVVAGGGFAGVETVAAINDFLRDALKFYPGIKEELIKVILVHPGMIILPELKAELGLYAQQKLSNRKVEILLNTKVVGLSEDEVILSDGNHISANTLIWTAGTSPNPILEMLPCAKERGKLLVNEHLEVAGHAQVWALGDCALVSDPHTGNYYPPTAQHALREGKVVAQNIIADVYGGDKKRFDFATIGQLAAIGRRTGVAQIFGVKFSGFLAWWMWRSIYLSKLPRFEKKLRVLLDWTLDVIFSKDLVQFETRKSGFISKASPDHSFEEMGADHVNRLEPQI